MVVKPFGSIPVNDDNYDKAQLATLMTRPASPEARTDAFIRYLVLRLAGWDAEEAEASYPALLKDFELGEW